MLEQTYTLTVRSCESHPDIEATFKHIRPQNLAWAILLAGKAFRQVRVTADETGEIIHDFYMDADWFCSTLSYGEAIDKIAATCYK